MDKKDQTTLTGASPDIDSIPNQRSKQTIGMARKTLSVFALVITATLTACSASASTPNPTFAPPATSVPQQAATPTQAPAPAATSAPQQPAAVNTQLDPCQLISSQEASTLAGASFGNGEESTTPGGGKICTYGSQTANVFMIEVAQAPDVKTAQADKAQFLADLQANLQQLTNAGLNVTELPNFADGATMATVNLNIAGISLNGGAIGFLKGTVFFGFSDVVKGGAAPSSDALQAEATTVLGRLP